MEKPITFDEIHAGQRVTVTHGPIHYATVPLEAPYDVTEREFDGGRDAPPMSDDNPLVRWALGMEPAACTRDEYTELKLEANAIRQAQEALQIRQDILNNRIIALRHKAES